MLIVGVVATVMAPVIVPIPVVVPPDALNVTRLPCSPLVPVTLMDTASGTQVHAAAPPLKPVPWRVVWPAAKFGLDDGRRRVAGGPQGLNDRAVASEGFRHGGRQTIFQQPPAKSAVETADFVDRRETAFF